MTNTSNKTLLSFIDAINEIHNALNTLMVYFPPGEIKHSLSEVDVCLGETKRALQKSVRLNSHQI